MVDPDGPESPPGGPVTSAGALRAAVVALVVVVAVGIGVLASSHHGAGAHHCTATTAGLSVDTAVSSLTTLPPSHDNDAGRSRIPDNTPDADSDSSALPPGCR